MKLKSAPFFMVLAVMLTSNSCKKDNILVEFDFNKIPDRIWVGEDFWTIPLEDWKARFILNERLVPIFRGCFGKNLKVHRN